jgi:GT2 family glycosyltransferase
MCVTIPAKDEEDFIEGALAALADQRCLTGSDLAPEVFEVILLVNNTRDGTAAVARKFRRSHPDLRLHVCELNLPAAIASVGMARQLMMDAAADRLPPGGIICTTDADTRVGPYWVAATLRAFDRGAAAVGGRIIVPTRTRSSYRKLHLQDVTYRNLQMLLEAMIDPDAVDPWPRHFQNYGPSTAIRVDAYRACGGMPALKCIEDVALARALERIDVTIVHDPSVRVFTSDRRSDRIDGIAFSQQLDRWADLGSRGGQQLVVGLPNCIRLYKWKVALRRAFRERRIGSAPALYHLADYLGWSPRDLQTKVSRAESFGCLYQEVRDALEARPGFTDTPFELAIRDLRRFTRSARCSPAFATRPDGSDPTAVRVGDSRRVVGL